MRKVPYVAAGFFWAQLKDQTDHRGILPTNGLGTETKASPVPRSSGCWFTLHSGLARFHSPVSQRLKIKLSIFTRIPSIPFLQGTLTDAVVFGWCPDLFFSSVVNWCIFSCLCCGCLCTGFSLQDLFNGLTGGKSNSLFDLHSVTATRFESSFVWISSSQGDVCSELDKHFLLPSPPLAFSRSDIFSY